MSLVLCRFGFVEECARLAIFSQCHAWLHTSWINVCTGPSEADETTRVCRRDGFSEAVLMQTGACFKIQDSTLGGTVV